MVDFKELSIGLWVKRMKIQIPKFIRVEIQTEILEYLKSIGTIITSHSFKFGSETIDLRYLIFNKAGNQFTRRLRFSFERQRSIDHFPMRNQRFYDEVFYIEVILDQNNSFTSSSYPNRVPNFKLPKFIKNGLNEIILDYVRAVNWREDANYIINTPSFKYFKNRITVRYFDRKFVEKKLKFRFIKSNSKVWNPTPEIKRVVQLVDSHYYLLRHELYYYKKA